MNAETGGRFDQTAKTLSFSSESSQEASELRGELRRRSLSRVLIGLSSAIKPGITM